VQALLERLQARGEHRAAFRQVGLRVWYGLCWQLLHTACWAVPPPDATSLPAAAVASSLPILGMRLMHALEGSASYLTESTLAPLQVLACPLRQP
jgi:hypothetical protein